MLRLINSLLFFFVLPAALIFGPVEQLTAQIDPPRNVGYRSVVSVGDLPLIGIFPSAGNGDDTARIQDAVDDASSRRTGPAGSRLSGARVFLNNGTYRISGLEMRSDVYMRFGASVTINTEDNGTAATFVLSGGISNVSIRGRNNDDRLRINAPPRATGLASNPRFRAFSLNDVSNFEIRNVTVRSRLSRFSAVLMSPPDQAVDGDVPTQGTLQNFTALSNQGGFGAVQMHGASRIRYENIASVGGVALRFESGIENFAGIQDIDVDNVRCSSGRATVLFQPHAIRSHNRIRVNNVRSVNCGYAVSARNGFVDRNSAAAGPAFTSPGRFRNVRVTNVTAVFGSGNRAQIRPLDFRLIAERFLPTLPDDPDVFFVQNRRNGDTIASRPLGAVRLADNYSISVQRSSVEFEGFPRDLRRPVFIRSSIADRNTEGDRLRREFDALR